jgi:uncharacterized protein YdeI (YjbR/CyaY-like superfamily)
MRKSAKVDVGKRVSIEVGFDPIPRVVPIPRLFANALRRNNAAKEAFEKLSPSRQKEILRYLGALKTEEALARNVERTIHFLLGKEEGHAFRTE